MADVLWLILLIGVCLGLGGALNEVRHDLWQRVRYCESCHSDSTENHTAFVHLCTDCYRIYRADHIAVNQRPQSHPRRRAMSETQNICPKREGTDATHCDHHTNVTYTMDPPRAQLICCHCGCTRMEEPMPRGDFHEPGHGPYVSVRVYQW